MGKPKQPGIGRGQSPNSKKALVATQVKPGGPAKQNAGRPAGSLGFKERLAKFESIGVPVEMPDGTITNQELLDAVIFTLIIKAKSGDVQAMKELFERKFGKEPEKIEIEDKELRSTVDDVKNAVELLQKHDRPY